MENKFEIGYISTWGVKDGVQYDSGHEVKLLDVVCLKQFDQLDIGDCVGIVMDASACPSIMIGRKGFGGHATAQVLWCKREIREKIGCVITLSDLELLRRAAVDIER